MSRIRTLKPEFWSSSQVASCSRDARLLFIGMWTFSDDHGVHTKDYKRLKMEIFPADYCKEKDITKWVNELIDNKLVEEYELEGKHFLRITGWEKHQKIDRPTYRYPYPFDSSGKNNLNSTSPRRVIDESSTSDRRVLDESSTSDRLRNGMETNGKEGNGLEGDNNPNLKNKKSLIKNIVEPAVSLPLDNNVLEGEITTDLPAEPKKRVKTASKDRQEGLKSSILEVFEYWRVLLHPKAEFEPKREKFIREALRLNSVKKLKEAIVGCTRTTWFMENNLTQLSHIFKDQSRIDMLAQNASKPPKSQSNYKFKSSEELNSTEYRLQQMDQVTAGAI